MTVLTALDLSLTATGLFHGDPEDPRSPCIRAELATPDRKPGEADTTWSARRFDVFSERLLAHLARVKPDLLVMEVTSHAHTSWTARDGTRAPTSRGLEFRAGLGLGRALGWIDGVLVLAGASGIRPARVELIEAKEAKLRVGGARGASKAAVRARLSEIFGWDTTGWRESEVDALACGLGWVRNEAVPAILRTPQRRAASAARRAAVP